MSLPYVIETLRPLPIEPLAGVPSFVRGVAIIRGIPTPVVDLGSVLGTPTEHAERFDKVRTGDRQVAFSVSTVLGVRELDPTMRIQGLPPLVQSAAKDVVEMIGALDEQLLMVLRTSWQFPDEVCQAMTVQEMVS
jgi:purine-binding chemotaxis protein CheW